MANSRRWDKQTDATSQVGVIIVFIEDGQDKALISGRQWNSTLSLPLESAKVANILCSQIYIFLSFFQSSGHIRHTTPDKEGFNFIFSEKLNGHQKRLHNRWKKEVTSNSRTETRGRSIREKWLHAPSQRKPLLAKWASLLSCWWERIKTWFLERNQILSVNKQFRFGRSNQFCWELYVFIETQWFLFCMTEAEREVKQRKCKCYKSRVAWKMQQEKSEWRAVAAGRNGAEPPASCLMYEWSSVQRQVECGRQD